MTRQGIVRRRRALPLVGLLVLAAAFSAPRIAGAGSFVFAGEALGVDIITHPSGYGGTGGLLNVEVCIDAGAANAAAMEIPIRNVLIQINRMTASTPNLFFGANNNIPAGQLDFESLALHEIGHCTSLAHPNLGNQTGVTGSNREFTQSTDGLDNSFGFGNGADGVIGSSDDQRGDDVNLHWFEKNVNNPCADVDDPDISNYSRDPSDLPAGHSFAANAERDVCALLGVADTEAVMQQGQGSDEAQRQLQADDVATYQMGMTGLDEVAQTGDDYLLNLVYGGIKANTSGCDIVVDSSTSGFGVCKLSGSPLVSDHWVITAATFEYNSTANWFFNQVLGGGCTVASNDVVWSGVTHGGTRTHGACNSITYGPSYVVSTTGNVTATAPIIILGNGTSILGELTAVDGVP